MADLSDEEARKLGLDDAAEKPNYRASYNTPLSPADQAAFQAWTIGESARRGRDVTRDLEDYDLQGYWKDIGKKDASSQGHMTDVYKKPNHPTFSDQSKYHNTPAPWGGKFVGGKWDDTGYTPSPEMLAHTHNADELARYFKEAEPDMKLRLPADHSEVDPIALGLEEAPVQVKPPVRTPGFFETYGDRLLRAALPVPNSALDAVDALSRGMQKTGVRPSFALNRMPITGPAPQLANLDKAIAAAPAAGEEVKAEREAGGKESPWGAGAGNLTGMGLQLAANPLATGPISGLMRSAGPAAAVLSTFMPKVAANLLTKGAAGAGAGLIAQAATGHEPTPGGAAMGAAGMIAPGLTGAGTVLHGLLAPGLSSEQRATEALGGGVPAVMGGMSAVNNMAPELRNAANTNALRALGMKVGDIRKAGGLENALRVGGTALKEKLIHLFDKTEEIAPRALERRNQVGEQIAGNLDALNPSDPALQAQMTPQALASGVEADVLPGLRNTAAKRPLMSSAQGITEDIRALGDKPLSFSELNRQKAAYGDEAYKAANPFNPSPQASVLQDTYRSLNNQMENLGEQVSKAGGENTFAQWLANKARYGDLDKAYQSSAQASNRAISNRAVSPSDYLVGTGGGVSPKSIALGVLNKMLRERGSSTLAVGLDKAAQLAGKVPNPMRALTTPEPAAPVPPQPPTGPALGPQTASEAFPAPKPTGNPLVDKANALEYELLFEQLLKGKEPALSGHPPADPNGDFHPPLLKPSDLPPAVTPQTSGALEPLTPRLQLIRRLIGEEPLGPTVPNRRRN